MNIPDHNDQSRSSRRREAYRAIWLFGGINSLFFLLNGRGYFSFPVVGNWEAVFRHTAYFSHFLCLSLVLSLLLAGLFFILRSVLLLKILAVLLFSLAQVFIFIDLRIFVHFKFHLSGLVIGAMTTPGYWDSVRFSAFDRAASLLALGALAGLELLIFSLLLRILRKRGRLWRFFRPRRLLAAAGAVLLLALAEKISFGVADYYSYAPITRYDKALPLYRPLTFKRVLARYLGVIPQFDRSSARLPEVSRLDYPLPGFRYHRLPRPYNVLVILVESLRFDMLDKAITPRLAAFSERAAVGRDHYSGGCTSRFGTFALFYGLYGTYWHPVLSSLRGPVLLGQLLHNDYLFKVMSSTSLSFPEFSRTVFSDLDTPLEDRLPGENSAERDEVLVDRWLAWLEELPPGRPFFSFVFLDSPHSPYNSPESFRKFTPYIESISYLRTDLEKDREGIFNRYKNAIHYVDYNVGRLLDGLEAGGFLANTLVVITGDHGQEFWEQGYYGHNAAYTDYQVRVPMLFWVPGAAEGREITGRTSHLDIPGTILRLLGDENAPALYTLGEDFFHPPAERALVLAGWDDCCLMTPAVRLRFSIQAYNILESGAVDNLYRPVRDQGLIRREQDRYLLTALERMGCFLK